MITRIKLNNWKSHLDSELSFSNGVNALIGIMGSGKTSVMQAIAFALFGTFSGVSSRRLALDDLIMKKPHSKDSALVELEFVLNRKKYVVKRVLEKGKGTVSAEIREDGKLLEVNPQGVKREVERILQMDYDLFQRAVYSEQNRIDYFLNLDPKSRKNQIDSMLKLDRYEKARESSVSIRNKIFERRKEKLRMIEDMKERKLDERIKVIEMEIGKKEKENTKIGKEAKKLRVSLDPLERGYEKKKFDEEEIRQKIANLNGRTISLKNEIKEAKGRIEESREIEKKLKELKKSLGKKPEEMVKKREKNLENKKKELYSLEALKKEVSKSLKELNEAGEKCPVCESKITKEKKEDLVDHRIKHLEEVENGIKTISKTVFEEESKLIELKSKIDLLRDMKSEIRGVKEDKTKIRRNDKEIKASRKKIEKLVQKKRKKEAEVKGMEKKFQEMIAKERELKTKLESLNEIIEYKKVTLKDLEKERDMFLEYVEETERYGKIIESMDIFVSVLRLTQDQLRDEFLKTVNYIMNDVWIELYPYGDFSEIRMLIENDYVLQLKGTKGWVNVDMVSGGERSLASLALRIAFSLAFTPNLRWLILDEPTHNLDVNAIEHFGSVLRDRMENIIDQVFLITHEERLSEYITGSIYRMERDKEVDGVTKIAAS
jgi:exonuclease SbcC